MLQEKVREFVQKTDSKRETVNEQDSKFIETEIDGIQLSLMIEKLEQTLSLNNRPKSLKGLTVKH